MSMTPDGRGSILRLLPPLVFALSFSLGGDLLAQDAGHPILRAEDAGMRPDARVEFGPVPVPEASALALQYYRSGNRLWAVGQAWALLVPALFLLTGASGRLRDLARRVGRTWYFAVGIYAVLYIALTSLIDLPFDYYRSFVRPHAYGLSEQTFGKWMGDLLKGLGVATLVGFLILWVPYLLLKRSPRRWWLWTWSLSVPFLCFVMLVKPVWFDPLFNRFGPMEDRGLERKILALADRVGIAGGRVYEVDKSRDTKTVNAYVTGLLGTHRIVLWDTLLARLDEPEVLFVMAHEMGHYALGHVARTLLLLSVLNLGMFYVVHRASGVLIRRFRGRFGFDDLADVASLPLFLLLFQGFALAATPLANAYSRGQEFEADRFALELTRANGPGATAFVKLQRENLGNPRPGWFYKLWRATHPSLGERIDFCNRYRPWQAGQPSVYDAMFRNGASPGVPRGLGNDSPSAEKGPPSRPGSVPPGRLAGSLHNI